MHPANERWRYSVTPSLIVWAHIQNDPCTLTNIGLKGNTGHSITWWWLLYFIKLLSLSTLGYSQRYIPSQASVTNMGLLEEYWPFRLQGYRADSRSAPSQWEMSLQSNTVSNWLAANLESALGISLHEITLRWMSVELIHISQHWFR